MSREILKPKRCRSQSLFPQSFSIIGDIFSKCMTETLSKGLKLHLLAASAPLSGLHWSHHALHISTHSSSHIPLLLKSYFLAAADLFGHSGACMIDVFLAEEPPPHPSPPLSLEVCGLAESWSQSETFFRVWVKNAQILEENSLLTTFLASRQTLCWK